MPTYIHDRSLLKDNEVWTNFNPIIKLNNYNQIIKDSQLPNKKYGSETRISNIIIITI